MALFEISSLFEQIKRWKTNNIYWAQWSWSLSQAVSSHTAVSPWSISAEDHQSLTNHTRGDVPVSVLLQPRCQQTKKEKKTTWHSLILGHHFSYISPHTLQHCFYQSASPSFNTDICCLSNQTRWKNTILVHFIHSVSFTCTWVPTYCTSMKDMKKRAHRWWAGDMTERLVEYSSKFIPPPDTPLEPLPAPSHNDIWINWYMYTLILKWDFGSFRLKYCSDIAAISYKKAEKLLSKNGLKSIILFSFCLFFCFYF